MKPPTRFAHVDIIAYALNIGDSIELKEPANYSATYKSKDRYKWLEVMHEEMTSLMKNNTWKLVDRHVGKYNRVKIDI